MLNNPQKYTDPTGHEGEWAQNLGLAGGFDLYGAIASLTVYHNTVPIGRSGAPLSYAGGIQQSTGIDSLVAGPGAGQSNLFTEIDRVTVTPQDNPTTLNVFVNTNDIPLGTPVNLYIEDSRSARDKGDRITSLTPPNFNLITPYGLPGTVNSSGFIQYQFAELGSYYASPYFRLSVDYQQGSSSFISPFALGHPTGCNPCSIDRGGYGGYDTRYLGILPPFIPGPYQPRR